MCPFGSCVACSGPEELDTPVSAQAYCGSLCFAPEELDAQPVATQAICCTGQCLVPSVEELDAKPTAMTVCYNCSEPEDLDAQAGTDAICTFCCRGPEDLDARLEMLQAFCQGGCRTCFGPEELDAQPAAAEAICCTAPCYRPSVEELDTKPTAMTVCYNCSEPEDLEVQAGADAICTFCCRGPEDLDALPADSEAMCTSGCGCAGMCLGPDELDAQPANADAMFCGNLCYEPAELDAQAETPEAICVMCRMPEELDAPSRADAMCVICNNPAFAELDSAPTTTATLCGMGFCYTPEQRV